MIFLLCILYFSFSDISLVNAQDYPDRKSLIMDVVVSNSFSIVNLDSGSYVESINATLQSYPKNDYRQDVYSISMNPEGIIGNDSIDYIWLNPIQRNFNISWRSEVRTQYSLWKIDKKVLFPIGNVDSSLSEYVKPTGIIDVTPEIRDLASSLSQGKDDLFEVEYIFADYVRKNIQYDLGTLTSDVTQKSSWVLRNRVGVCDELTNLFISLNRAVGIPARFVSGTAYTELGVFETNWVPHAWAEVYFPEYGWVPYDVTYGQYGFIDSGHIKMMDGNDGRDASVKYDYIGRDIRLDPGEIKNSINVIKYGELFNTEYDFSIDIYDSDVGFGSYNLVEVQLHNPKNYYLVADLYLANTEGLEIIEQSNEKVLGRIIHRKEVLLKPFESKKVYWLFQVKDSLNKNFVYTFPVNVYNSLNKTSTLLFNSKAEYNIIKKEFLDELIKPKNPSAIYNERVVFRCTSNDSIYLNENVLIKCSIDNKADRSFDAAICLDQCTNIDLDIELLSVNFSKTLDVLGMNNIIVRLKADGIEKTSFVNIFVKDKAKINIINVERPEVVPYGDEFYISFDVEKASVSNPRNLTISIIGPTVKSQWQIPEITSQRRFVLNSDGKSVKPNINDYVISVEYFDGNEFLKETEEISIMSEADFFEDLLLYINQLAFWFDNIKI